MLTKGSIKGLYVPLITPMNKGVYDGSSMRKLIKYVDPHVSGYVPCLSSGEGHKMGDKLWYQTVKSVREITNKPVIAGIKRKALNETVFLATKAKTLGCDAIIVPVPSRKSTEILSYFTQLSKKSLLPIMIYNTESDFINKPEILSKLDALNNIIAIKDSSMNLKFFSQICNLRIKKQLQMNVLQGMEHLLDTPKGCDGYLVSLLNTEPKLVHDYYISKKNKHNKKILELFYKYNLGGQWFVTLKGLLYERGIISSAEEINPTIKIKL
jgi:4-hydroxy-tetrahydrodipicolinate synthase